MNWNGAWKRRLRSGVLLLVLCALLAVGRQAVSAQEPSPPFDLDNVTVPEQPPAALLGASIYAENCAPCHGPSGAGDGPTAAQLPNPPASFADWQTAWERSPAEWFHVIKYGRIENLMPPWQNRLSDREIWQSAYYAWELHTSAEEVRQGRQLYEQSCQACHGAGGAGDGAEATQSIPSLADLERMMSLSPAQLDAGWRAAHAEAGADWSDEQRRAVLDYLRTFTYRPSWTAFAIQGGEGSIQGRVEQGSPEGGAFAGEVTLEAYVGGRPVATLVQNIDAGDAFQFDGLSTEPGIVYVAALDYNGVRYTTAPLAFDQETADSVFAQLPPPAEDGAAGLRHETTLGIFETSDDDSGLFISRGNWIVEQSPGALLIGQVLTLGNSNQTTFVGKTVDGVDAPVTVAIPLPAGAENVGVQDGAIGEEYRLVGDVLYDTRPVQPGQMSRQIFVRYFLPHEGEAASLVQPFAYPARDLSLLLADLPGLEATVESDGADSLVFEGVEEVAGNQYRRWSGTLQTQQSVTLDLSGLLAPDAVDPRPAPGSEAGQVFAPPATVEQIDRRLALGMGGALLVAILAMGWVGLRRETAQAQAAPAAQREALIEHIARLDDLRELGQLSESDWQRRRAGLKRELLRIASADGQTAEAGDAEARGG